MKEYIVVEFDADAAYDFEAEEGWFDYDSYAFWIDVPEQFVTTLTGAQEYALGLSRRTQYVYDIYSVGEDGCEDYECSVCEGKIWH